MQPIALVSFHNLAWWVTEGKLPPRILGLVVEWASSRQTELMENWQRASSKQPLNKIEPLE